MNRAETSTQVRVGVVCKMCDLLQRECEGVEDSNRWRWHPDVFLIIGKRWAMSKIGHADGE